MSEPNWRSIGAALAPFDDTVALLLVADSPVTLAALARGVAGAVQPDRRVAVFDLAGAFGLDEPDGLVNAFHDGRSLNALARPFDDGSHERFVVPRGHGALDAALATHERWPRLVEGFRAAGALLVIVAPVDFDSRSLLVQLADRALRAVVREGVASVVPLPKRAPVSPLAPAPQAVPGRAPPALSPHTIADAPPASAPLPRTTVAALAQSDAGPPAVDAAKTPSDAAATPSGAAGPPLDAATPLTAVEDGPEAPAVAGATPPAGSGAWDDPPLRPVQRVRVTPVNPSYRVHTTPVNSRLVRRTRRRIAIAGSALVLAIAGGWYYWSITRPRPSPKVAQHADSLAALDATPATRADTLALPEVVNPEDSIRVAQWGVELVATNDRSDANLRLAEKNALQAETLSPVLLGEDSVTWYKIVVGAFVDRTAAELLRRALRQVGTIEPDAGVVSKVPFAFRLDTALTPDMAKARATAYVARGIAAYALQDDDGRATVYAGAFASPEQAVLLQMELRAAGMIPQLAFRVGRSY
jgi:hypothetical protein